MINSRTSKLTRISWRPSITRLPFGSTCVTTAATVVASCSERRIEPWPSLFESEVAETSASAWMSSPKT